MEDETKRTTASESLYDTPNNNNHNMENQECKKPSSLVKKVSVKPPDADLDQVPPSTLIPSGHVERHGHKQRRASTKKERKVELTKTVVAFVSDTLSDYYSWKAALYIFIFLAASNIAFFFYFIWHETNKCEALVQVFDASRRDAVFSSAKESGNTHLCSTEQVSLRS